MRPPEDVFNMLNSDIQKCTPDVPRCVRCTLLGIEECVYRQRKERKVGNSLRMGEACLSCRSVFRRIRGQSHATQVLICDTVPPRKRKRVSPQSPVQNQNSNNKRTEIYTSSNRNATPDVHARLASTRTRQQNALTRIRGRLTPRRGRSFRRRLQPFRLRVGMILDPRVLVHRRRSGPCLKIRVRSVGRSTHAWFGLHRRAMANQHLDRPRVSLACLFHLPKDILCQSSLTLAIHDSELYRLRPPRASSSHGEMLAPNDTPTTTILLCHSSPPSCLRRSPRCLTYRSRSWENRIYKFPIRLLES